MNKICTKLKKSEDKTSLFLFCYTIGWRVRLLPKAKTDTDLKSAKQFESINMNLLCADDSTRFAA